MLYFAVTFLAVIMNALAPADQEAAYTQAINKRADDIIAVLNISDQGKSQTVHDVLVAQYRALRDWHDANDATLKKADKEQAAAVRESLKTLHDQFLAKLATDLTPEQVEKVKDKMTYNKVKVTYDAYVEIAQNLNSEQKAKIMEMLKEAREEAIDGGSAEEKSAIFKKYKGKINNFLSSEGIDMKQKTREWGEREKAKSAGNSSTQADDKTDQERR